jgi:hypothetical protein
MTAYRKSCTLTVPPELQKYEPNMTKKAKELLYNCQSCQNHFFNLFKANSLVTSLLYKKRLRWMSAMPVQEISLRRIQQLLTADSARKRISIHD